MERKIRISLIFLVSLAVIVSVILAGVVFHGGFRRQVLEDLRTDAGILSESYRYLTDSSQLSGFVSGNLRLTLTDPEGRVLYESGFDAAEMENHSTRPEIVAARQNGSSFSVRASATVGKDTYYYAVLLEDGNVLRLAVQASNVWKNFSGAYPYILIVLIVLVAVACFESVYLTRKMMKPIKALSDNIDDIENTDVDVYQELLPFVGEISRQRRRIENQLKELEQERKNLSTILQNMSEGLLVMDMQKNVILANAGVKIFLRYDGELENKNIVSITRNTKINGLIDRAARGEKVSSCISFEGRSLQIIVNPVWDNLSQVGIICFILDVTEKSQIEKMKQEFTANVSHELKTPLTSISGYAELLENGMVKAGDIQGFASRIHKEAKRLLALISDIIKLSELDERNLAIAFENVDLYQIAEECADILATAAKKQNIAISVEGAHFMVRGSSSMLSELVYNLCDNAIRYNRENGNVKIQVAKGVVTVSDNGIGIPKDCISRVFERFYRVDKSRSKETGGTGLGLAIVKHIAEQHKAKVVIDSTEGQGTDIKVIFQEAGDLYDNV